MAVTLKTAEMRIKDSNGAYNDVVDILTSTSTEGYKSQIRTFIENLINNYSFTASLTDVLAGNWSSTHDYYLNEFIYALHPGATPGDDGQYGIYKVIKEFQGNSQLGLDDRITNGEITETVVGEELRLVKNAIAELRKSLMYQIFDSSIWQSGGWNGSNGNGDASTNYVRTKTFLNDDIVGIYIKEGYKVACAAYSQADDYLGTWSPTKNSSGKNFVSGVNARWTIGPATLYFNELNPEYKYKLSIAKSPTLGTINVNTQSHMLLINKAERLTNDIVLAQDTQPTTVFNKIWIPTTGQTEVEIPTYEEFSNMSEDLDAIRQHTRNLFEPHNIMQYYWTSNTTINYSSSDGATSFYIPCKPNTKYVITKISSSRFIAAYTNEFPAQGVQGYGRTNMGTGTSLTITTGAEAQYLFVYFYLRTEDTSTFEEIVNSIRVEEGSAGEGYIQPYTAVDLKIRQNVEDQIIDIEEYDPVNGIYKQGDLCKYNGKLYECFIPIDTPEAWALGKWRKTSLSDLLVRTRYETEAYTIELPDKGYKLFPIRFMRGRRNNGVPRQETSNIIYRRATSVSMPTESIDAVCVTKPIAFTIYVESYDNAGQLLFARYITPDDVNTVNNEKILISMPQKGVYSAVELVSNPDNTTNNLDFDRLSEQILGVKFYNKEEYNTNTSTFEMMPPLSIGNYIADGSETFDYNVKRLRSTFLNTKDFTHVYVPSADESYEYIVNVRSVNTDGTSSSVVSYDTPGLHPIPKTTDRFCLQIYNKTNFNTTILDQEHARANIRLIKRTTEPTEIVELNDPIRMRECLQQMSTCIGFSSGAIVQPLVLLHFSDLHRNITALQRIVEFRNAYTEYIDDTIHTGDAVGSINSTHIFGDVPGAENILNALGNHDTWRGSSYQTYDGWRYYTETQSYERYISPFLSSWGDVTITANHCYYYKDYTTKHIRLIVLDCMHETEDQLTWFANVLDDARINNLHVIVADHVVMAPAQELTYLDSGFCSPVTSRTTPSAASLFPYYAASGFADALNTFVSNGGKIACWLAGHKHVDTLVTYNNILNIAVTTAGDLALGRTVDARVGNTKSYDAFNLVGIDTVRGYVYIKRVGLEYNCAMKKVDTFCWDYINHMQVKNEASRLSEEKNQFNSNYIFIEQGYWAATEGIDGLSNLWCRTKYFLPNNIVLTLLTHRMLLQAWSVIDNKYIGTWNGSTFGHVAPTTDETGLLSQINISDWIKKYPSYKFKITFRGDHNAAITPSDIYNNLTTELDTVTHSKFLGFLENGADLNELKSDIVGFYMLPYASNYLNDPIGNNTRRILYIYSSGSSDQYYITGQTLISFEQGKMYTRFYASGSGWSEWKLIDSSALKGITDPFSDQLNYSVGNIVQHNGKIYQAKENIIAGNFNSSEWQQRSLGEIGFLCRWWLQEGNDLNDYKSNTIGFYLIPYAANILHDPIGPNTRRILFVYSNGVNDSSVVTFQMIVQFVTGTIYTRFFDGTSGWSEWTNAQNEVETAQSTQINKLQFEFGKYVNYSGGIDTSSTFGLSQVIMVHPGDKIVVNVPYKDSNNVDLVFGIHQFHKAVWTRVTTANIGSIVTIPDDIDSIRIVFGRAGSTGIALTRADLDTYCKAYIIHKNHKIFEGKRVSIIGTSDSTFAGYIPSENVNYYTGSNYNIRTVGDCWWHIGITENGGLPLINDSWSGSTVADIRTPTQSNAYTPLVALSRCQNLHAYQHGGTSSDTLVTNENISILRHSPWDDDQTAWTVGEYVKEIDPDVIIINGGGNDYIQNCPMGTYNGHTTLSSSSITTFREAYANLINRIQARYPYALVICCTPIYLTKPNMTSPLTNDIKNQVNINGLNLTYKDYQDAIKEIATLKGCPVIDGFVQGFSRYNYYNLFCSDSETGPVHPNALGHMVLGKNFAKNLENCITGLIDFS